MISMMMMHISLIIIIIALVAEEPGGLSVPGLSLMLQLLVSRDGKVTDSAQRVPEPDPLPGISFDTRPDPIQFWKSSGSG